MHIYIIIHFITFTTPHILLWNLISKMTQLKVPNLFTTHQLRIFKSLRGVPEGSIQLQPTQLTRMWRLEDEEEEEERGKAFPKSSFPWKKRKREAEQRYFHWHGSGAAIIRVFLHTTTMSLLFDVCLPTLQMLQFVQEARTNNHTGWIMNT